MNSISSSLVFLFSEVLTRSLQASAAACIIIIINKLFKKHLNPRLSYLLWGLVLLRLVMPVFLQSPVSIYNLMDTPEFISGLLSGGSGDRLQPAQITASPDINQLPSPGPQANSGDSNSILSADKGTASPQSSAGSSGSGNITVRNGPAERPGWLYTGLAYLWLAGAVSIIGYLAAANFLHYKKIKALDSILLSDEILEDLRRKTGVTKKIRFSISSGSVPGVSGLFKYTVLLPQGLVESQDGKMLRNILLHEYAHIKRKDLPVNWIGYILCGVHWFNPMMWLCCLEVRRLQEECADAFVLSLMAADEIADYGLTLLEMSKKPSPSRKAVLVTAGIHGNKKALKDRIMNISSFSEKKYKITAAGLALFALIAVILCTSAARTPKTPQEMLNFQNNLLLSVSSPDMESALQDINLEIHNKNSSSLQSCRLYLYDGPDMDPGRSAPVFEKKNFSIGSGNSAGFHINEINYDNIYFKLTYNSSLSLFKKAPLTISGRLKDYDSTAALNHWGAVSEKETADFINAGKIAPIGIAKIYDFYTVVLFRNGTSEGYYELYKNTMNNEVCSRMVQGITGNSKLPPVSLLGGTASGMFPFVNVIINETALSVLGKKLVIEGGTGKTLEAEISENKGYTLETRGLGDIRGVLIYDKEDNLIYNGKKSLLPEVNFNPEDKEYWNIFYEKGRKILSQTPVDRDIQFTSAMFPSEYVRAYMSGDIDLKVPMLEYKNSTLYLKSISEANGDKNYLFADFYFIHEINESKGTILSSQKSLDPEKKTGTWSIFANYNAVSDSGETFRDAVSLAGSGPGDRFCIYIKKELLEKTKGNFTVHLEQLNEIRYE